MKMGQIGQKMQMVDEVETLLHPTDGKLMKICAYV